MCYPALADTFWDGSLAHGDFFEDSYHTQIHTHTCTESHTHMHIHTMASQGCVKCSSGHSRLVWEHAPDPSWTNQILTGIWKGVAGAFMALPAERAHDPPAPVSSAALALTLPDATQHGPFVPELQTLPCLASPKDPVRLVSASISLIGDHT